MGRFGKNKRNEKTAVKESPRRKDPEVTLVEKFIPEDDDEIFTTASNTYIPGQQQTVQKGQTINDMLKDEDSGVKMYAAPIKKPTEKVVLEGFGPGRAEPYEGGNGTHYNLRLNAISRGGKRGSEEAPPDELQIEELLNDKVQPAKYTPKPRKEKVEKMVDLRRYKPLIKVLQENANKKRFHLFKHSMLLCQPELKVDVRTYDPKMSKKEKLRLIQKEKDETHRRLEREHKLERQRRRHEEQEQALRLPIISEETYKIRFPDLADRVTAYDIRGNRLRKELYIAYGWADKNAHPEELLIKLQKYRNFASELKEQSDRAKQIITFQREEIARYCAHAPEKPAQVETFDDYLRQLKACNMSYGQPPAILPGVRIRRRIDEGSYPNWTVPDENNLPTLLRYTWKGKLRKMRRYLEDRERHHKVNYEDDRGRTPLHYAASWGCIQTLNVLLQIPGIELNKRDEHGKTPLYKAVEINSIECVKALLAAGANPRIHARDSRDPLTSLMHFHGDERFEMFELLYEAGEYYKDDVDPYSVTLLHKAIAAERHVINLKMFKFLIENGHDLVVKEGKGRTPLHVAVICGRTDIMYLLLAHVVNIFHTDDNFKTAMDYAPNDSLLKDLLNEFYKYGPPPIEEAVECRKPGDDLYLTKEPHMGGSQRNNELGDFIAELWKSYGMKVYKKTYEVLLSEPESPAVLQLLNQNGSVEYEPKMVEEAFFKEENSTDTVPPFNAFSGHGDITGELVNVNFGREEDFDVITQNKINLQGKIVIAMLDLNWRGEKARLAEEHGAAGILLFSDPNDGRDDGSNGYPENWGLPPNAIRRGGLLSTKGDPLTQGWPAKDGMYRNPENSLPFLPKIPVQPISQQIAEHLLRSMDGIIAPDHWRGSFNLTYRITSDRTIRLKVDTHNVMKNITNVFGVIRGDTEPDRLVIIGNHRDGWVYGAGDPSSGTACMMEVARVIGQMNDDHNDWKPRRTIVFASWDAEEYQLSGSMEWLEEYSAVMQANTVAYINVDIAVSGNYSIRTHATPSLSHSLFKIAKKLQYPDNSSENGTRQISDLYESWKEKLPSKDFQGEPNVELLTSGSDFAGFFSMYGIPCIDIRYEFDTLQHPAFGNYPTYHTIYDNYNYFNKFIDPDMRYHKTVSEMLLGQVLSLADDVVLPLNLTRYAEKVEVDWTVFQEEFGDFFKNNDIPLDPLDSTITRLKNATVQFQKDIKRIIKQDKRQVRAINDQLMWFERALLVPEGARKMYGIRHIMFGSGRKSMFSRSSFRSISETLYDIMITKLNGFSELRMELSILINCLENAIKIISEDGFNYY